MEAREYTLRERIIHALIGTPLLLGAAVTCYYIFDVDLVSITIVVITTYMTAVWPGGAFFYRKIGYRKPGPTDAIKRTPHDQET